MLPFPLVDPEAGFADGVADILVIADPEVTFPAVVSAFAVSAAVAFAAALVAGAAELRASPDIPVFFDVSDPVSLEAAAGDSPGHPMFLAVPNAGYHASPSSYAVVDD